MVLGSEKILSHGVRLGELVVPAVSIVGVGLGSRYWEILVFRGVLPILVLGRQGSVSPGSDFGDFGRWFHVVGHGELGEPRGSASPDLWTWVFGSVLSVS